MTDRFWLALAVMSAGCADAALYTGDGSAEPFFVVSGPIDESADVSGDLTRAAVAWTIWAEGGLSATIEEVPFEPRVLEYALSVLGPPRPGPMGVPYPPLDGTELAISWGLPVLVQGRGDLDVEVDAARLADWMLGQADTLVGAFVARGEVEIVAATTGHALTVLGSIGNAARLDEAPGWSAGGPACRSDAVVPGLTLYRDAGGECEGWQPIASPGERTEFQGIPVARLP